MHFITTIMSATQEYALFLFSFRSESHFFIVMFREEITGDLPCLCSVRNRVRKLQQSELGFAQM